MSRLPAAQRREQLLDTAAELFATRGYARATTFELARAAGVTEPIIYRHFKSKRDLFVALIRRTGDETLQSWSDELENASDPADRLVRLIRANPMVNPHAQFAYRVILQGITEVHDEVISQALDEHMRTLHGFLTEQIIEAQESRHVHKRFSADIIAWLLIDVGLGYGVLDALGVEGHGLDDSKTHVVDVIVRMLLGKETRQISELSDDHDNPKPAPE